jgi:hypothetical protein
LSGYHITPLELMLERDRLKSIKNMNERIRPKSFKAYVTAHSKKKFISQSYKISQKDFAIDGWDT